MPLKSLAPQESKEFFTPVPNATIGELGEIWQKLRSMVPSSVPKFRIEVLPTSAFLTSYCGVSHVDLQKKEASEIFFERFLDDGAGTLLQQNMWLRERFYFLPDNGSPRERVFSIVVEKPLSDIVNALYCKQYRTGEAIQSVLKEDFEVRYHKVFAGYIVFRYHLAKNCTVDQVVLNSANPEDIHEVLSVRFESEADFFQFSRIYANETIPTNSKVFAFIQRMQHEPIFHLMPKSLQEQVAAMPKAAQSFLPKPDLSRFSFFSERDYLDEEETDRDNMDIELLEMPDSDSEDEENLDSEVSDCRKINF